MEPSTADFYCKRGKQMSTKRFPNSLDYKNMMQRPAQSAKAAKAATKNQLRKKRFKKGKRTSGRHSKEHSSLPKGELLNPSCQETHDSVAVLAEAQTTFQQEDNRSRESIYKLIWIACREGRYLQEHPEQFLDAVRIGPWPEESRARPKASDVPKAVYFTTIIIFNAKTSEARAKAGKYASAAQSLADQGFEEEGFISELRKYGVEKLNRMAAAQRRKGKHQAIPAAASEPDAMTLSLEGMDCGQTPSSVSPPLPESLEEPRFKAVTALADAKVAERLAGMQVYLVERSNGRIMASVSPDEFVSPD